MVRPPALVLVALLAAPRAAAAEPAARVRFDVRAPCSDAHDFARRVGERTARVTSTDDAKADVVEVVVQGADTAEGTFRVTPSGGEPSSERRVEGTTCEEVVDALSLSVALTYDPEATFTPRPAAPPPKPSPTPAPAPRPPPVVAPPVAAPPPLRASLGALGTAAAARRLPLGVLVFVDLAMRRSSARLAFGLQHVGVDVTGRSADFTWALLVPEVCPWRLTSEPLELSPCLGLAMGIVEAQPREIPGASSFTRAWIAPKPALRLRMALSDSVAAEAQLALEIPLVRGRYTFAEVTAYEIPAVVPSLGLGLSFTR